MYLTSVVQAGGLGVMVWHILGQLIPTEHCLNITAYLNTVAYHTHPFVINCTNLLVDASSWIRHHAKKLRSCQAGFLKRDIKYAVLKWPPQLIHFWDVVEWETHH